MSGEDADLTHMRHALAMGRRGLGQVWPDWPAVGCVLVQAGRVVGRGTSDKPTNRHAEVVALEQAGTAAHGATAYVTLEPCAHHGTTPPCADALIAAGVARVVVAAGDPDPRVNGAGIQRLRDAGIEVREGLCATQAARDHAGFFLKVREGRPMVTLKLAASLDGRIATASGESRWITGPAARARVHGLRASHDLVLVGGGTARADDPALNVRGRGPARQPVRAVVSRHLDLPDDAQLRDTAHKTAPVWIFHAEGTRAKGWTGEGIEKIGVATGADGQLSPQAILGEMAARGITRVFCEGGGMLAASLISAGLVDALHVFHAGLALGAEGTPAIGSLGLGALAEAQRFDLVETRAIGPDVETLWHPRVVT